MKHVFVIFCEGNVCSFDYSVLGLHMQCLQIMQIMGILKHRGKQHQEYIIFILNTLTPFKLIIILICFVFHAHLYK